MRRERFDAIVLNSRANFGKGGDVSWIEADQTPLALVDATK